MDSISYLEASARTASTQFHTDKVDADLLASALKQAIDTGNRLDVIKKSLFYGKDLDKNHPWQALKNHHNGTIDLNQIEPDVVHAAIGLYTEATELLESVLSTIEGQDFDAVNTFEECGDAEWYLAMLYRALDKTPAEARAANIAKLKARYPEKFATDAAINRDLAQERAILEAHNES